MVSLIQRMLKTSTIQQSEVLQDSTVFNRSDFIPTKVPMVNVALSGRVDGGISSGLTVLAGPSKHFKSAFGLLAAATYLKHDPEAIVLFYDSEFGSPKSYFESFGIDMNRVIHTPITDVEELKHDIANQLKNIEKKDKVLILIDSVGNLASKKEVADAVSGNSAADMTRAKQLKSMFRIVTPHLTLKDIPMFVINHTYETMEMFSKQVVSGGKGIYYSADNIWIIGRQQEKNTKGLQGYNFIVNIEKSRHVVEKSKIPIQVTFEDGIKQWSGLREVAVEVGYVVANGKGKWSVVDQETGEIGDPMTTKKMDKSSDVWVPILANADFRDKVANMFTYSNNKLMGDDDE